MRRRGRRSGVCVGKAGRGGRPAEARMGLRRRRLWCPRGRDLSQPHSPPPSPARPHVRTAAGCPGRCRPTLPSSSSTIAAIAGRLGPFKSARTDARAGRSGSAGRTLATGRVAGGAAASPPIRRHRPAPSRSPHCSLRARPRREGVRPPIYSDGVGQPCPSRGGSPPTARPGPASLRLERARAAGRGPAPPRSERGRGAWPGHAGASSVSAWLSRLRGGAGLSQSRSGRAGAGPSRVSRHWGPACARARAAAAP